MNKKILLVYPNNFYQSVMGENARVKGIVKCLNDLNYDIDYFSFINFNEFSDFDSFEKDNEEGLIKNVYLYDYLQTNIKYSFFERVFNKLRRILNIKNYQKKYLGNWISFECQKMFDRILKENNYDIIVFFYAYMATLLEKPEITAKKIYFMEDCTFLQQYTWENSQTESFTMGQLLDDELKRLKFFNEIFCISYDEKLMYEKLLGTELHFLPYVMEKKADISQEMTDKKWDIYFIGFNNPFNVEGLKWFLEEVYSFVNPKAKLVIVGTVSEVVEIPICDNIEVIPYVENLDDIYDNAKICICPMFRGTGMKIKVVEAMSRGIPIVCNERGVDGLPDKVMSGCLVTQNAEQFAFYINRLLSDTKYYEKISEQLRDYYNIIFDRQRILQTIKKFFEK